MVPPGYQMHTRTTGNGENVEVGTPEAIKQEEAKQNGTASQKPLGAAIGEAIVKVINEVFCGEKKAEGASEGQGEPCEEYYDEDKNDNPEVDNIVDIGVDQSTDAEE